MADDLPTGHFGAAYHKKLPRELTITDALSCHDQDPFVERLFRKVALSNFLVSSSPPFAARDFLDCPNHLPKVGKVKVSDFSAVLDLKILQPNFKTRLTYIKNDKLETRSKFGQQQLELTS